MSPHGRLKGEYRKAQSEGSSATPRGLLHGARRATWRPAVAAGLAAALLAACASVQEGDAPPQTAAVPRPPRHEPPVTVGPRGLPPAPEAQALITFEKSQRSAAEAAAAQQRWVDAIWAWEVVLALKPRDAQAQAQRSAALAAVAAGVAERLPRAAQARQRGEWEAAHRLYLEVLALAPGEPTAADALREMERQRARRTAAAAPRAPGVNVAAILATNQAQRAAAVLAPAMPAMGAAATRPTPTDPTDPADRADSNDLEHASLLAAQGEIDAAIALLRPLASGPRANAAARAPLAELYWRQAERQEARGERGAAITALQRCLQLVPGHRLAAARLALLQGGATR